MTLKMLNDFLYQIECAYEDCIKSDDFDFEDTPKFDKVFDILYSRYYKIGSGSSRRVWALDKNTVIKMAKDRRGMAQNLVELRVFEKSPDRVAKIKWYHPKGYYLIVERCASLDRFLEDKDVNIDADDFSDYVDINVDDHYTAKKVQNIVKDFVRETKDEAKYKPAIFKKLAKEIKELATFIWKNKIHDIYDDQLGVNKAGKIILLDYGMDQEVWEKYY
jgi:hypothetical protein